MFYSQTISKARIENLCAKCETKFKNWTDYHTHVTTVKCAKLFKPVNLSGRSKMQIVADWELKNKGAIIQ